MSYRIAAALDAARPRHHHQTSSCIRPLPPRTFTDTARSRRQKATV